MGTSPELWSDFSEFISEAVPSLEKRCFNPRTPEEDYDGLSGSLIALHNDGLRKDLDDVHSVVLIARNILIIGEKAQTLCAENKVDKEMFKLVHVCVKVAARGYDGEPGHPDQKKFDQVVESFKNLLICSLQFLNNLTVRNERRKLMLWFELFDSTTDQSAEALGLSDSKKEEVLKISMWESAARFDSITTGLLGLPYMLPDGQTQDKPPTSPLVLFTQRYNADVKKWLKDRGQKYGLADVSAECQKRWDMLPQEEKEVSKSYFPAKI
jgi:palmitoyltransferase